eukprot:gene1168-1479_t
MTSLFSVPVGSIFPTKTSEIFSVNSNDTVKNALKMMVQKKVLSLPVFDTTSRRFNKFVDMVDIVSFCMKNFSKKEVSELDLTALMESREIFDTTKVADICDNSGRNPYKSVEAGAPLSIAIDLMVKWNVHRIPVIDAEGTLVSILTQSRVVDYINHHIDSMDGAKKLKDIDIGTPDVVTIRHTDLTWDAFRLIHDSNVSAVGVVDENSVLIGNVSVSDMKMIGFDGSLISRMYLPVETFIQMIPKSPEIKSFNTVLCVQENTTLEETMLKFNLSRVHRLYLVDNETKPLKVISQGDILKYYVNNKK